MKDKIVVRLGDVNRAAGALQSILAQRIQDPKVGYKFARLQRQLQDEIDALATAHQVQVGRFSITEDGKRKINPERLDEFNDAVQEIFDQEIEVEVFRVRVDDLVSIEASGVYGWMASLMPFLIIPDDWDL